MGQNFSSEPVVEKETERVHNDIFNVAVSSCQGWRTSQEDNHSLMLELPGEHKAAFFAVYDGHGSAVVSKHASDSLWRHLIENEQYLKGNFQQALAEAFLSFDREVNESYNAQLAGTTAVCLLIVNNNIYCANIGDSRGVASVDCKCVPLSYDHKPENPQELKRILAAGGYVLGNRVNGNLALSRAFGDFHYKGNEQLPPEQQIVSPCPDVKTIELNDDVDFLLLACDGIWDVLTSEEVVDFVISHLEHSIEPGMICEQLTTRCLATDYELVIGCDNMTVLLVCYTRGRSWVDFCTDIFNKNTKRLGVDRTRPTPTTDITSITTNTASALLAADTPYTTATVIQADDDFNTNHGPNDEQVIEKSCEREKEEENERKEDGQEEGGKQTVEITEDIAELANQLEARTDGASKEAFEGEVDEDSKMKKEDVPRQSEAIADQASSTSCKDSKNEGSGSSSCSSSSSSNGNSSSVGGGGSSNHDGTDPEAPREEPEVE